MTNCHRSSFVFSAVSSRPSPLDRCVMFHLTSNSLFVYRHIFNWQTRRRKNFTLENALLFISSFPSSVSLCTRMSTRKERKGTPLRNDPQQMKRENNISYVSLLGASEQMKKRKYQETKGNNRFSRSIRIRVFFPRVQWQMLLVNETTNISLSLSLKLCTWDNREWNLLTLALSLSHSHSCLPYYQSNPLC